MILPQSISVKQKCWSNSWWKTRKKEENENWTVPRAEDLSRDRSKLDFRAEEMSSEGNLHEAHTQIWCITHFMKPIRISFTSNRGHEFVTQRNANVRRDQDVKTGPFSPLTPCFCFSRNTGFLMALMLRNGVKGICSYHWRKFTCLCTSVQRGKQGKNRGIWSFPVCLLNISVSPVANGAWLLKPLRFSFLSNYHGSIHDILNIFWCK